MHFARHGIPDIIVSDNSPQFDSDVFRCFTKMWKFQHVTSSPRYPQSNGKVENAVKICKGLMKKAEKSRSDICLALLDFRNTLQEATGTSQVHKIFGRRTRTLLPTPEKLLRPEIPKNTSTLNVSFITEERKLLPLSENISIGPDNLDMIFSRAFAMTSAMVVAEGNGVWVSGAQVYVRKDLFLDLVIGKGPTTSIATLTNGRVNVRWRGYHRCSRMCTLGRFLTVIAGLTSGL